MSNKEKREKQKRGILFWFVFLLAVSVIATSILTTMLMDKYYFDASGAIDISPNNPTAQQQPSDADGQLNTDGTQDATAPSTTQGIVAKPGFEASDASGVWTTNTKVDIFKSSYTNKVGQLTVKSSDGDKIIAPGTSNSFVFKLANTGNVPLDFELDLDAYVTEGYELPVKVRLHRYDNTWLLGDKDNWMFIPHLDQSGDKGTMGPGKYFYYTLEWEWPFNSDGKYDTYLGNEAKFTEDISLTIVINTSAQISADINADMGITIPNTGDTSSLVIWGTVAALSLVIIISILIFIILLKRRDDEEEEENSALEDTQIEESKKD